MLFDREGMVLATANLSVPYPWEVRESGTYAGELLCVGNTGDVRKREFWYMWVRSASIRATLPHLELETPLYSVKPSYKRLKASPEQ